MTLITRSGLALCLAVVLGGVMPAYASPEDDAKLKELERAMNAPSSQPAPAKKKYGTRAIVFDNEPQQAGAPAEPPKAALPRDCAALPPDTNGVAVDFAIQFKLGSAEVARESEGTLMQIAKILGLNPERCVLVEGHTDATGNPERNLALSRERADSVVKFIVERAGMERTRLVSVGRGQNDPLKNLDPRNPKNRRVVFKVVN